MNQVLPALSTLWEFEVHELGWLLHKIHTRLELETCCTCCIWQANGSPGTFASTRRFLIALEMSLEFTTTSMPATPYRVPSLRTAKKNDRNYHHQYWILKDCSLLEDKDWKGFPQLTLVSSCPLKHYHSWLKSSSFCGSHHTIATYSPTVYCQMLSSKSYSSVSNIW